LTKFNSSGSILIHPFGSGFNASPESCVVDATGNVYVGQADGSGDVLKFSPSGALLGSFNPATESRGTDWIDLAADQCTLFYTSEGTLIKRFNVCAFVQQADFATGLPRPCFALRIRPNGEVLVACASAVQRLSAAGTVLQTYTAPGTSLLFALNLDPDGQTFWTGDLINGEIFRFNIATGAIVEQFSSAPNTTMAGLAVFGEITVARRRMVGKGSVTGGGRTAAYAYILNCNAAANANAPFEVRFNGQRFRLTSTNTVSCTDDPAVTTPAAGFDTMIGTGAGTLTTGGPGFVQFAFVDGGTGGASDRVALTIRNAANAVVFQGTAAPPAKFPGSDHATGNNTAQSG
jgi:hypothetical protein